VRVIDKIFTEIETFNGEPFTLIDISHGVYARHYLRDLVELSKIKILPEKTLDRKQIYIQVMSNDERRLLRKAGRQVTVSQTQ